VRPHRDHKNIYRHECQFCKESSSVI